MTVKVKFPKDIREYARKEKVKDSLIKLTETALAEAISKFHRRMIVLQGDTLNTLIVAIMLLLGAAYERAIYIDIAIVYALLSYVGTLVIAKYLQGGLQ